jgi:hypothetical protein
MAQQPFSVPPFSGAFSVGFPQNYMMPNGFPQNNVMPNGFPQNNMMPNGFPQNNVMPNGFNFPNNQMGARPPIVPIISKRSVDAYGNFRPHFVPSVRESTIIPRGKRGLFGGDDTTASLIIKKGNKCQERAVSSTVFPRM